MSYFKPGSVIVGLVVPFAAVVALLINFAVAIAVSASTKDSTPIAENREPERSPA